MNVSRQDCRTKIKLCFLPHAVSFDFGNQFLKEHINWAPGKFLGQGCQNYIPKCLVHKYSYMGVMRGNSGEYWHNKARYQPPTSVAGSSRHSEGAYQDLDKIRGQVDLLGDGVGEGAEGPAHAVREGAQQDPAKVDLRFLYWADYHRHKLRTSNTQRI